MVDFTYSCATGNTTQLGDCLHRKEEMPFCFISVNAWTHSESKSEYAPHKLVIKMMEFQLESDWHVIAPLSLSFQLNSIPFCSFTPDRDESLKFQKASTLCLGDFQFVFQNPKVKMFISNIHHYRRRSAARFCGYVNMFANSTHVSCGSCAPIYLLKIPNSQNPCCNK